MKTAEEILAEASRTIANIHNRPAMYVGDPSIRCTADTFDGMMRIAHSFWATIQSRQAELSVAIDAVREAQRCRSLGFPGAYRWQNPDATNEDVFQHVRACWAEIAAKLGIDISLEAARPM
jgi:hypothetical protein